MSVRKAERGNESIPSLRISKQSKPTKQQQQKSSTEAKVKPPACHFQFFSPHEQISV